MILEFSIANTFSINEKQTISFEAVPYEGSEDLDSQCVKCEDVKILKLACIYGANASGKTKMLEALDFYIHFMLHSFIKSSPYEHIPVIPFAFGQENKPSKFELIMYIKDRQRKKYIRYNYNLKLTKEKVVYEELSYAPQEEEQFIFKRDENNKIKWNCNAGTEKIIEAITRDNSSVVSIGAQVKHPLLKSFYDEIYFSFRGMIETHSFDCQYLSDYVFSKVEKDKHFKKILVNLLSASDIGAICDMQITLEEIPDILIKSLPLEIQKQIAQSKEKIRAVSCKHNCKGKNYLLPFALESEGTKRFMQLVIPLYDLITSKSIVLIDELESSLHGALVELFLKLFLELSDESQLLFTTHNQDLLDSGLLRDDEVWFCYKTEEGSSVYNSITDYTEIKEGISRKALYNADKFGALPKINFYLLKELFNVEKNRQDKK